VLGDSLAYGQGDEKDGGLAGRADVIVLSIGANDLFRTPDAHIMLLGAYNPIPDHPFATLIDEYVRAWDRMPAYDALAKRIEEMLGR
jgi:hypothetical protein